MLRSGGGYPCLIRRAQSGKPVAGRTTAFPDRGTARLVADRLPVDGKVIAYRKPGLLVFGPDVRPGSGSPGVVEGIECDVDFTGTLCIFIGDGRAAVRAMAPRHSGGRGMHSQLALRDFERVAGVGRPADTGRSGRPLAARAVAEAGKRLRGAYREAYASAKTVAVQGLVVQCC